MNETLYIYYIVPDFNFVSQKETNENSTSEQSEIKKLLSGIASYFPYILILLLIYFLFKQVSK